MLSTPCNEQELILRANQLYGKTFTELAQELNMSVPVDLRREKGWVGQLIEHHLGAAAGSRPEQDFPALGIELKTIPVDYSGNPLETTFVCVAPLIGVQGLTWEKSHVKNKLSKVLWVPVLGEREVPVGDRVVGFPILWTPTPDQDAQLQQDWEEIMDLVVLGKVQSISARIGEAMQLRPKAANGQALTDAYGESGNRIKTRPRGFYLRKGFTKQILIDGLNSSNQR
ncbi:DNA mismatch repair endonuclease MutH [Vibrio ulleungensis]|uniref:DNA mismatch repair protein MutH n=1 Tax=Vibrio ulleungensis TaxID=2807619 RepID=A0ABS2HQF3_9VIBR|nr:DNA mismatch repair endonuclease MutH [Vibrio ulleungensis]MBM7038327.1 DNA mismatch repair endonuclease MutH [Vibrio ulleungensis]